MVSGVAGTTRVEEDEVGDGSVAHGGFGGWVQTAEEIKAKLMTRVGGLEGLLRGEQRRWCSVGFEEDAWGGGARRLPSGGGQGTGRRRCEAKQGRTKQG